MQSEDLGRSPPHERILIGEEFLSQKSLALAPRHLANGLDRMNSHQRIGIADGAPCQFAVERSEPL